MTDKIRNEAQYNQVMALIEKIIGRLLKQADLIFYPQLNRMS